MTVCDISRGAVSIWPSQGAPRLTACNGTSGSSSPYQEPVTVVGSSASSGVSIVNAKIQILLRRASIATFTVSASDVDLYFDGPNTITSASDSGIECSASSNVTLSGLPGASVTITGSSAGIGPPESGACKSILIRNGTYDVRGTAGPGIGAGAGSTISAVTILEGNITATASTTGPGIGAIARGTGCAMTELTIAGGNITAVSRDGRAIGGSGTGGISPVSRVRLAGSLALRANTGSRSGNAPAIEAGSVVLDGAAVVARTDANELFSASPSRVGSVDLSVLYETAVTTATDQVAMPGFEIGQIVLPSADLWTISFRNSTWSKAILVDAAAVRRLFVSVPAAGDYQATACDGSHTGQLAAGGSTTFAAVADKRFISSAELLVDATPPAGDTATGTASRAAGPTATISNSPSPTTRESLRPTASNSPTPTESDSPSPTESNTPIPRESDSPPPNATAEESLSVETGTDISPAGGEDSVGYGKGHTALVVIAVGLSVTAIVIFIVMNRTKKPRESRSPFNESL
jgi:hypothetical protein